MTNHNYYRFFYGFEFILAVGFLGYLALFASAADQTWTGQISDSMCGDNHAQMIADKYKDLRTSSGAPGHDCTLACVKSGASYVFVADGRIYKIANQNLAALTENAGNTVQLTGDMQGDMIVVSNIAPAAAK